MRCDRNGITIQKIPGIIDKSYNRNGNQNNFITSIITFTMKNAIISVFLFTACIFTLAQPPETTYLGNITKLGYADDDCYGPFDIGFDFTFFDNVYNQFYINSNGQILFEKCSDSPINVEIPSTDEPNNFIAPFWDDLVIDSYGSILYKTIGAAPNRKLIVQFKNMGFYPSPPTLGTFSVILYEGTNVIQMQYRLIVLSYSAKAHGGDATIGLENSDGTAGVQYAYHNTAAVNSEQAISFTPASGPTYIVNSNAMYDGVYLTTNISKPEPGITKLINPPPAVLTGTEVLFEWADAQSAESYTLFISTDPGLIGATRYPAGSDNSIIIPGLVPGTYYWGVFASNSTGITWCEIRRFFAIEPPPCPTPVPQTIYIQKSANKIIKLGYSGGNSDPKLAIITSLPSDGILFQYEDGNPQEPITSVPCQVIDPEMRVIYTAPDITGNDIGNFKHIINDELCGDSQEGLITIHVIPVPIPNVLCLGKSTDYIEILFDIPMADPEGKQDQFTAKVDGSLVAISSASLKLCDPYKIVLTLKTPFTGTETVQVAYNQGDISGADGGILPSFNYQEVILNAHTIDFPEIQQPLHCCDPVFNLSATSSCGLQLTYTSYCPEVLIVQGNKVSFVGPGICEITAISSGSSNCCPARCSRLIVVENLKCDQIITFDPIPVMDTSDIDFSPGAVASSGLDVYYTSSDTCVATIINSMIHIVGNLGTTIITASQPGNKCYNEAPKVSQLLNVTIIDSDESPVLHDEFRIYALNGMINIVPINDEWNGKIGSVKVIDITGRIILDVKPVDFRKNSLIQVAVPNLKGIYIVELKTGILQYFEKINIR